MSSNDKRVTYSASVISTSPVAFFDSLDLISSGVISRIHVDIMDGSFVPRLGLFPEFVKDIRKFTSLPIDCHVMTLEPERHVADLVAAGATRIVPHIEAGPHAHRVIQTIRDSGLEAGLALNPHTVAASVTHVLELLDVVTVMAINPGVVGHKIIPSSFQKVETVREFLDSRGFEGELEVDGGVTFENIEGLHLRGADSLVVGAGTLFHPDAPLERNLDRLRKLQDDSRGHRPSNSDTLAGKEPLD